MSAPFTRLQLKVVEGEKQQREKEASELQTRLSLEEQREEERGKDAVCFRQRLAEAEAARETLKREVRHDWFFPIHVSWIYWIFHL